MSQIRPNQKSHGSVSVAESSSNAWMLPSPSLIKDIDLKGVVMVGRRLHARQNQKRNIIGVLSLSDISFFALRG